MGTRLIKGVMSCLKQCGFALLCIAVAAGFCYFMGFALVTCGSAAVEHHNSLVDGGAELVEKWRRANSFGDVIGLTICTTFFCILAALPLIIIGWLCFCCRDDSLSGTDTRGTDQWIQGYEHEDTKSGL